MPISQLVQNVSLPPSRHGLYLCPPWIILADILWVDSLILGVPCVRISLDYMKKRGRYRQKCAKNGEKRIRLVIRYGFYLRPLWTVLAEILGDNRPISWLSCVRISLDCFEARGSSAWKRVKNAPKNQFLNFWYNRVRLPRGLIFGFQASLGSYGHRTMYEISKEFLLYQS